MVKLKKIILITFCITLISITTTGQETQNFNLIGDDLDLYAVLDAFKNAETLDAFEKQLNDSDEQLNNLDLNEDKAVDYISVIDNMDKDIHAIILRIAVEATELQDVAVIELEKTEGGIVTIQIVGDKDIYGEDYIVEPFKEEGVGNMPPAPIIVNVFGWSVVRHIFAPNYSPWRSPYGWNNYPPVWKPRHPLQSATYHNQHISRHNGYRVVHIRRNTRSHKLYGNHRRSWGRISKHSHHHSHHKKSKNKKHKNNQHKSAKKGHSKSHKGRH